MIGIIITMLSESPVQIIMIFLALTVGWKELPSTTTMIVMVLSGLLSARQPILFWLEALLTIAVSHISTLVSYTLYGKIKNLPWLPSLSIYVVTTSGERGSISLFSYSFEANEYKFLLRECSMIWYWLHFDFACKRGKFTYIILILCFIYVHVNILFIF